MSGSIVMAMTILPWRQVEEGDDCERVEEEEDEEEET